MIGTSDRLNGAKQLLRATLTESGHLSRPEGKGLVYVVRSSDGGLL